MITNFINNCCRDYAFPLTQSVNDDDSEVCEQQIGKCDSGLGEQLCVGEEVEHDEVGAVKQQATGDATMRRGGLVW